MWVTIVKESRDNPTAERVIGLFATSFIADQYAARVLSTEHYYVRMIQGVVQWS